MKQDPRLREVRNVANQPANVVNGSNAANPAKTSFGGSSPWITFLASTPRGVGCERAGTGFVGFANVPFLAAMPLHCRVALKWQRASAGAEAVRDFVDSAAFLAGKQVQDQGSDTDDALVEGVSIGIDDDLVLDPRSAEPEIFSTSRIHSEVNAVLVNAAPERRASNRPISTGGNVCIQKNASLLRVNEGLREARTELSSDCEIPRRWQPKERAMECL